MDLEYFLAYFSHFLTLYLIFPAILFAGLYFTYKLRFIQISHLKESFLCLWKKNQSHEGHISRFEAISTVLAGNFGTGNISGMAVAIATGGPGALVWMWVMAFFGSSIQLISCILGRKYRCKTELQEYVGGPMYYLRDGLGKKKTAALFAIFTLSGAITVGNFAQINSILLPLQQTELNTFYCSFVLAFFVGAVILGGIHRLAKLASLIVPFKALIYLGTCFIIIFLQSEKIIPAFKLMFQHAFGIAPLSGGIIGMTVLKAITTGFDRGLFATDAGTGIVPILQASARSENPILDGISTLIAPLMVMVVCTSTGLVLLVTDAWTQENLQSTNMVTYAFSQGLHSSIGGYIVLGCLILFAYTTILAWSYCGEKAFEFLFGSGKEKLFRYFYTAIIPIGALLKVQMIWVFADISISLMLFINLIGVVSLSGNVIQNIMKYKEENEIMAFE